MITFGQKFKRSILHPLYYGVMTGALCGGVIALFLICSKIVLEFSFGMYENADGPLFVVCLLMLAVICALIVAVVQTLCPKAKGSGIPLAEGAARGMLSVKWLSTAAALIAGSILGFLSGMPLGSEGPSIGVGGLIGDGVGKAAKKPIEFRRFLITGGACSGLAVAFNAPLAGICFAFEETHRKFSPYLLAAALSAVTAAVAVSQALFYAFGKIPYLAELGVGAGKVALGFLPQAPLSSSDIFIMCAVALAVGVITAAFGTAFDRLIEWLTPKFSKIKSPALRLVPVFVIAAAIGIILPETVGSGEITISRLNVDAATRLLITVLIVRFALTVSASCAGATGGLFLPMIAIGGLTGMLLCKLFGVMGLDAALYPNVIIMCVCAFFASTVRAPVTAIALSLELTASFTNLLPCAVAVAVATAITELTKTEPLYEAMLDGYKYKSKNRLTVTGKLLPDSPLAYKRMKNVLWPYNSLVTELIRKDEAVTVTPDDETTLLPNDKIILSAENVDPDLFYSQVKDYIEPDD